MARNIATKFIVEGDGEYKNALKGIDGELKTLKSEMALASSALKNQQGSMEALTAKGEVLTKQYEQQAQKVQVMRSAQENATKVSEDLAQKAEAYRKKIEETEVALKKLEGSTTDTAQEQKDLLTELENSAQELKKIESAQKNATKSTDTWSQSANYAEAALNSLSREIAENNQAIQKLDSTSDEAEKSLCKMGSFAEESGNSVKQMGTQISGGLDAMAGALAAAGVQKSFEEIASAIEECTTASKEFKKGMAETFTLIPGLSNGMREQMSGDLLKLKTDMAIVGKDGTDALYQAVSAGVSAGESMQFMETAQKAAVGGVTTLTTAVDGLTSVTNAYGAENVNSEQAADLMFTAIKLGKTNFEQLSGSLYNVIPIAANNKIAFEDITAAIATMTAQGIPTAQSTTQLQQLLIELTDSGSEVSKTFQEISGVSFKQFVTQGGNTQQALQKLYDEAQETGVGINELFSSVNAGGAAMALSGSNTKRFAENIGAMKNSAGACGTAYKEMSNTADFSSKKMQAAAETLKISIGDVMEPQLKKLNEVGATAFEWAAKFVEENPWIVASIEALMAALGVLALALAGITIASSILIPAITALKIAFEASPWGIVTIAVVALVAAIGTLAEAWPKATGASIDAVNAAEESADRLKTVADETKSSADAVDVNAEVCKKLVKQLRELESTGLKTAESQKEYADIISQINELMPDLNLEIDEQTGLLKENNQSLEKNIDTMKNQAKAKVYTEQYTSALEEQAKAEVDLEKFRRESGEENIKQLNELIENRKRYAEVEEKLANGKGELLDNEEYIQLSDTLAHTSFELLELEEAQNTLTGTVDSTTEAVASAYGAYDEYNQKIAESAGAQTAAAEAAGFNAEYMAQLSAPLDKAAASMQLLKEEFFSAQEGISNTIDNLFGTFNNVKVETELTADELLTNLDNQIAYMDSYQANLAIVIKNSSDSINKELIAKLSDGSMESAEILQAMVGAADTEIQAMNEKFGKVSEGKDKFSTEIGKIATDFNKRMDEIKTKLDETVKAVDQTEKAAHNAGITVSAIVDTVRNRMDEVFEVYAALGEEANRGYRSTVRVNSPSRTFMEHTDSTIEGIELAAKTGEGRVRKANQKLAESSIAGYKDTLAAGQRDLPLWSDHVTTLYPSYQKNLDSAMANYYRGLDLVRQSQTNHYDSRKTSYSYGDTYIVDGVTYDDGSNVSNAVKSIVRAARVERRK